MSSQPNQATTEEDTEQSIIDYLKSNPDFFDRNPELLQELELSHSSGDAVSLIERQVRTLREQNEQQKQQLHDFVAVARENELLNDRLHNLTLSLIDTLNFDEVVNVLEDKLHDDFQAEAVELHLFDHAETNGDANPDLDGFRDFINSAIPRCGRLQQDQLSYLFGAQADDIQSTALIPIMGEGIQGLLAIGSHSEHRFHPGMGTDYLSRLGEIISKTLEVVSEPGF
ncbi:DUF484 family protein [Solemya velesiana gill symbiont]|uniref:Phytochrome sensor protein n=1 Tax=Solemya velesiana gill symbiont TaxID=1918948 RepID=A0A1T2KTQ0_9GAMM|nr:DUF484 family protein [Solemya velesiana gill symbiont]OOZ36096.1 hypothetical protein BOW51_08885 [Solemya velesiana gill symbiont]